MSEVKYIYSKRGISKILDDASIAYDEHDLVATCCYLNGERTARDYDLLTPYEQSIVDYILSINVLDLV